MGLIDVLRGTPRKRGRELYVNGGEGVPRQEHPSLLPSELQHPFILLLVQMMKEDGRIDDREYARICTAIVQRMGMDDYGARDLVGSVLRDSDEHNNSLPTIAEFHRQANDRQRQLLVDELLEVAVADEEFHPLEAALLRKIAAIVGKQPSSTHAG